MGVRLKIHVVDKGRVVNSAEIRDDNWDGALFDFQEAQKQLTPSQWLWIPDYWSIPEPHRIAFA